MKKILIFCALFAFEATIVANAPKAVINKAGYISSTAVINESKVGKKVRGELEETFKSFEIEMQKKEQEVAKAMNEALSNYKERESTLSAQARENEQAKIMKIRRDFEVMAQEKEGELKRIQQKYNDQLTKEALQAAAELGKAKGLDAVIDTDSGKALYVASSVDYSSEFTAIMNRNYAAENKQTDTTKKSDSFKKTATA